MGNQVNQKMQVKELRIKDLKPAKYNPRTIDNANFDALVESIKQFGQRENLVVNKDMTVISGHMRLIALQSLDYETAMCDVLDLNKTQEKKLNLIMNNPHMQGKFVDAKVDAILAELQLSGDDLDGLRLPELGSLDSGGQEKAKEDEAPSLDDKPPVSKLGKIYKLGKHRLMCGDATIDSNIKNLMSGIKADMVLTDPPYGMYLDTDYSDMKGSKKALGKGRGGNKYDKVIGDNDDFTPQLITTIFNNFKNTKEVFLFGADYYTEFIPNKNNGSWLVWDKRKESQKDAFGSEFELIYSKQKHKRRVLRHDWFGFISSQNSDDAKNRVHPTQKPLTLLADIMNQWGKVGDHLVDMFGGSGSTLIACEQIGRTCYMMELDPRYIDVIRKRYAKLIDPENWENNWQDMTPELGDSDIGVADV